MSVFVEAITEAIAGSAGGLLATAVIYPVSFYVPFCAVRLFSENENCLKFH